MWCVLPLYTTLHPADGREFAFKCTCKHLYIIPLMFEIEKQNHENIAHNSFDYRL